MGYIEGCVVAMQQSITQGRKSELSSCFCTNYSALLRFGKVTNNLRQYWGWGWGLWHCSSEESSYAHRNSEVGQEAHVQQLPLCHV